MADVHTTTRRRARKGHGCCECRLTIEPGERYVELSGVYDGEPYRYRRCLSCEAWADAARMLADLDRYLDEDYPVFGGVAEWLGEWAHGQGGIYVPPADVARLARLNRRPHWADYVPWGCYDGWSTRRASAPCASIALVATGAVCERVWGLL